MRRIVLLALTGIFLSACREYPTTPAATPSKQYVVAPDESYIVLFRNDAPDVTGLSQTLADAHAGQIHHLYQTAVHGFAAYLPASEVEALRRDPNVILVEHDALVHATVIESPAVWGLDRIDQASLPLDNSYSYTATGAGVNVYIIDSGIRSTHSEFGGRASGVFTSIGTSTDDCNGHGTHVAGTIGGTKWGVAKLATLKAVRVLDCDGSGFTSGVIAGVDWVTANAVKPAVANMSLGGGISSALDLAVQNSIASGISYAIAAGNSNADACSGSPARVPTAITVGATSITDGRASFSNFGTCLDIFAPGVGVKSAWNGSDTDSATISGTSMASPHVAGVAALYLQLNPIALPAAVASALIAGATANVVTSPGTGSANRLLFSGVTGSPPPPPPPPSGSVADFTYSCTGLACNFDGRISTGATGYSWNFGDGTGGGVPVHPRTYADAGTYTVTLTTTPSGAQSVMSKTIVVGSPPPPPPPSGSVADFTYSCTGLACNFDGRISTGATGYSWNFGDGTGGGVPVHPRTYAVAGTYTVTLTTSPSGTQSVMSKTIVVGSPPPPPPPPPTDNPPVANFTWSCASLSCTLDASSSTDDVTITQYNWDVGKFPNPTASGVIVTIAYPHAGNRTVTLTVTDNTGKTNQITKIITLI